MLHRERRPGLGPQILGALLAFCVLPCLGGAAFGQYHTTEESSISEAEQSSNTGAEPPISGAEAGPVRMARFASVQGEVSWRADSSGAWSQAEGNLPVQQGAQIWVTNGGRANLQFDDGSELRLGNGALITLKSLYSDANGEFTQISLQSGLATLATRHGHSIYQIDAPVASVMVTGQAVCRLGVGSGLDLAVHRGACTVENREGKVTLGRGQYLYVSSQTSALSVQTAPAADGWDRWNADRDEALYAVATTDRYVPANIALVCGDLDRYGSWRVDASYGAVWVPRPRHARWRPYSDGRWVWVAPYGWTWVAEDPWGWAPYHYGTWVYEPYGWAWCPGPAHQYWCPAVVSFCDYHGSVCWAPLAPCEVRYPSALSVGFRAGNWSLFFSIGQAGCYYPYGERLCIGRPFERGYRGRSFGELVAYEGRDHRRFVPYNVRTAAGATLAPVHRFGDRGGYREATNAAVYFTQGRVAAAPSGGRSPAFGPVAIRSGALGAAINRPVAGNERPPVALMRRTVFHGSSDLGSTPRRPLAVAPRNPGGPALHSNSANAFGARDPGGAAAAQRARLAIGMGREGQAGGAIRLSGVEQHGASGRLPGRLPSDGWGFGDRRTGAVIPQGASGRLRSDGGFAPSNRREYGAPAGPNRTRGAASEPRSLPDPSPRGRIAPHGRDNGFERSATPERYTSRRWDPSSGRSSAPERASTHVSEGGARRGEGSGNGRREGHNGRP